MFVPPPPAQLFPRALVDAWRHRASEYRRTGAADNATAWECAAQELEDSLRRESEQPLSIKQAAREGHYSEEQLRRILREHPHLNAGRPGKPLILRRDAPRKPQKVVHSRAPRYDVVADAQSLMSRQESR